MRTAIRGISSRSGSIDKARPLGCLPQRRRLHAGLRRLELRHRVRPPRTDGRPDVYDVIPLPTADLPGPPDDNAPEVITECEAGSTDVGLRRQHRGRARHEGVWHRHESAGVAHREHELEHARTTSATANLMSFEEAGVVETIPGSNYVSASRCRLSCARSRSPAARRRSSIRRRRLPSEQSQPAHDLAVQLRNAVHESE